MSSWCIDGPELLGSTRTHSASTDPVGPVRPYLCFLWMSHEEREKGLKNISSKARECCVYSKNTHMRGFPGVSISHPRTWYWDPWPIREAGLWKSRNLGIGFWQRACWHGDMLLQLSWTWMTWVCYWGEKLATDMHTCIYMHMCMYSMSALPSCI